MLSATKLTLVLLTLSACVPSQDRFSLPPGNIDQGKLAFAQLQCNACHTIGDQPSQETVGIAIALAGSRTKVDSYASLVTSIINPSHRIKSSHEETGELPDGTSAMHNYNETMTVQQLIDLVTYLQSEYQIVVPEYYYPAYY